MGGLECRDEVGDAQLRYSQRLGVMPDALTVVCGHRSSHGERLPFATWRADDGASVPFKQGHSVTAFALSTIRAELSYLYSYISPIWRTCAVRSRRRISASRSRSATEGTSSTGVSSRPST